MEMSDLMVKPSLDGKLMDNSRLIVRVDTLITLVVNGKNTTVPSSLTLPSLPRFLFTPTSPGRTIVHELIRHARQIIKTFILMILSFQANRILDVLFPWILGIRVWINTLNQVFFVDYFAYLELI